MKHKTYVIINEETNEAQGACACGWRGEVFDNANGDMTCVDKED